MLKHTLRISRYVLFVVGLSLSGCTTQGTDWVNTRPPGVPLEARYVGETGSVGLPKDLYWPTSFTMKSDGTVWVVKAQNGKTIWTQDVKAGDRVTVDLRDDSIKVNDGYAFTGWMQNSSSFVIYATDGR